MTPYPPFRRHPAAWLQWHLLNNWANQWTIARHWRLEVEWVPKARYWTLSLSDRRRA